MRQITIVGNIGTEPTKRIAAKSGKEFFTFSVADNSRDKTLWFNVICYRFNNIFPYLTKGRQVLVQGSFDVEVFKDNPDISLYADVVELLGKRDDMQPVSNNGAVSPQATSSQAAQQQATGREQEVSY